ncbi:hypothetical protein J5N97_018594 [Dioscorea zingiberensis]|uniref:GPI inositol-deacylase n=1 Tax=Dioscorea zingiberensis TaxID=325984 RepID=A0A9D5HBX6_9LILI|nr:hypothetical protein J5N97_018594 [Dioscorea zingiberensis]
MANAATIKEHIEKLYCRYKKPVVILGHSKGGLDAAAALSIYWNKLGDKVVGLVLAQSPYAGNPIASDILRQGLLKHVNLKKEIMEIVMSGILNVSQINLNRSSFDQKEFGFNNSECMKLVNQGDLSAIEDLTYEKRREFLRSYPLPREIPVVSFHTETKINMSILTKFYEVANVKFSITAPAGVKSSSKISVPWPLSSMLAVMAALLKLRYGEKSDGLVTRKDAEAPGSVVVRPQRYLDHEWMVLPSLNEDRKEANNCQVIEALFTLLIEVALRKGFLVPAN